MDDLPTILVIDDSPIVLETTRMVLESAGYRAVTVSSPFKINEAIRNHRPSLILLDVNMPVLSGEKAAQILKQYKLSKDIPILLHSEVEEERLQELLETTGAAGFVRKGRLGDGLLEAIAPWLRKPAASGP